MKIFFEPNDAKYLVFRFKEGEFSDPEIPPGWDGRWEEKASYFGNTGLSSYFSLSMNASATAHPTNRFEVREDGDIAQVYVIMKSN